MGAYSLIIRAAAREMGPAMATDTTAMAIDPSSNDEAPKWPVSGDQLESVKNRIPAIFSACQP